MRRRMHRVLAGLLCLSLAATCLGGCVSAPAPSAGVEDVLTQKAIPAGRTPVTVLVKYAFAINAFEQAVEEKFPDIDLVQVGNYTFDRGVVEYERRMEHDDLTDIMMAWPLEAGKEYWEERLLDLSGMPYTGNYNTSMLDSISQEGKLYYLPGPAQIRGVLYNKTLFEEKGWQVPEDFDGFVALCQEIEESGIRSIQLGFRYGEVLDTAFTGWSFGNCYNTPADAQWLNEYNEGKGSFGDQFGPALDTFETMMEAGIWLPGDLELNYAAREQMFFNRKCAMIEDSVLMTHLGYGLTGTTDEFALMPFFSPDGGGDWARLYMVCYIGLNKHLAEPENKEKYALVQKVMEFISTPEGQEALIADNGTMYSSVKGVPAPDAVEIAALRETLNMGRCAAFPELKNAQGALRRGLAGMLTGELTRENVVRMVDEENQNPPEPAPVPVLGSAAEDFTLIETGNFITDVMRAAAESDVALFLDNGKDGRNNGSGVSARFYEGEITREDLWRVLSNTARNEEGTIMVAEMTGADLMDTLEYAVPVDNDLRGWFYYFSGLKMTFAPAAEPGSRIKSITTADGAAIEPERVYTVAFMDGTYPDEKTISVRTTKYGVQSLLAEHIETVGTISPNKDGRFTVAEP